MSFIETDRLLLRAWILPGDVADAQSILCNPQAQKFYLRGTLLDADVGAYVARIVAKEERDGFGVWPVMEKATRELVGACGLSRIDGLGEVEIEWVLKPEVRGRGYAQEAACAVMAFAFDHLRLPRICAVIDAENAGSIAIANRLGMRYNRIVRAYKRDLLQYVKTAA